MRGREYRYRLFRRVDAEEGDTGLSNPRQAFLNHIFTEMIQFQQYIILVWTTTAAFAHFSGNGAADHIATGQIFRLGRITLHQALAISIDQITALTARAFGNQHAVTGNAGGVKLEKLHILQRHASTQRHRHAVAGIDQRIGGGAVQLPCAAGGQQGGFGLDNHRLAIVNVERQRAQHMTFFIFQQVDSEVFIKEMRLGADVLLVQAVQNGVAGAVSCGAGARRLIAAEVLALAAERTLIN